MHTAKGYYVWSLYITKAILFAIIMMYMLGMLENPEVEKYKDPNSKIEYVKFTNIACVATILAFNLGLVYRKYKVLFSVYNLLIQVALSFEFLTTVIFWVLYFLNRPLIVSPEALVEGCETPIIANLGSHLFPLILMLLDQCDIKLVIDRSADLVFLIFIIGYYTTSKIWASLTGKHIYGFLDVQSELGRIITFLLIFAGVELFHHSFVMIRTRYNKKQNFL